MSEESFEKLWFLTDEIVDMPDSAEFPPTGFIGQVSVEFCYRFLSVVEPDLLYEEGAPVADAVTGPYSGYYAYYYLDRNKAKDAYLATGDDKSPGYTIVVQMDRNTILNFGGDEADLMKWQEVISQDVNYRTFRSPKYYHEFQLLYLPALVAACADVLGMENSGFDITELANATVFSEEFHTKMIGSHTNWQESELGKQRAKLWKSLGEDNPMAFRPIGTQTWKVEHGKEDDTITTSPRLSNCLMVAARAWAGPVWARMILINDPRHDAHLKSDPSKQLNVPVITELYHSKEEAQAAADAEAERMGKNADDLVVSAKKIPAAWADMPDEWEKQVEKLKAENATPTVALAAKLGVEFDELEPFLAS